MTLALGVDVGNAKLKLCVARAGEAPGWEKHELRWLSRPLPYDDRARYRRHADFEAGVPAVLQELLGSDLDAVRVAVVVTSSGYAYPTYREGIVHTMALLERLLPRAQCLALAHDGETVPGAMVASCADPTLFGRLTFTNGMGAAHLARRIGWLGAPTCGVVVDTGGTTSQVATIVDGTIEPATVVEGERYLEHRLRRGKATWVGTQTTPLEFLAREVPVGDRSFPVLPRGVTFDAVVAALELTAPELAGKLSLFGLAPSRSDGLRAIADSVNLDRDMATEAELVGLAHHYLDLAISRLASELRVALETVPSRARRRALVFGLGAEWLTMPALLAAGVAEVAAASRWLRPELAEIASCYGACHLALESIAGHALPIHEGFSVARVDSS